MLSMLLDMCSHLALCSVAVQKCPLCMCFSSKYFRRGLTTCRQKQTADDLLLIASSSFFLPLSVFTPSLRSSHSLRLPRYFSVFIFLVSSLFSLFPPPFLITPYPQTLCSPLFFLSSPVFLHLLPPACPFIPLIYPCVSPFFFLSPLRCPLSACSPVCLFHKGLSEASAVLIHSLCIASHVCRVRQTDRKREKSRRLDLE